MLDKEQILWFCKEKESPKHKKKATRWPLFDDEKGYLPFFVLLSCGAGVSSFSTAS